MNRQPVWTRLTEHALFEHFALAARRYAREAGTITLLVSHRFSTVRIADLILVLSDGGIAEQGQSRGAARARRLCMPSCTSSRRGLRLNRAVRGHASYTSDTTNR